MRAITCSAAQLSMAVADTCAQQVRIAAGWCSATTASIVAASAGSGGPATRRKPGRFEHLAFHPVVGPGAIGEQNCGHR